MSLPLTGKRLGTLNTHVATDADSHTNTKKPFAASLAAATNLFCSISSLSFFSSAAAGVCLSMNDVNDGEGVTEQVYSDAIWVALGSVILSTRWHEDPKLDRNRRQQTHLFQVLLGDLKSGVHQCSSCAALAQA